MTISPPARNALILGLVLLAAAAAVLLGTRGGPVPAASAAAPAKTLRLSANKSKLAFDKTRLTVRHGRVTLVMANPSSLPHAIAVEGHGVDKDGKTVNQGGTSRVTLTLKKGTYDFYCPVDGHRAAGMKGKLVVQ
jgi:plastocyanin